MGEDDKIIRMNDGDMFVEMWRLMWILIEDKEEMDVISIGEKGGFFGEVIEEEDGFVIGEIVGIVVGLVVGVVLLVVIVWFFWCCNCLKNNKLVM